MKRAPFSRACCASPGHTFEGIADRFSYAHTCPNTSGQSCTTTGILGCVTHRICGLQLGIGLHIQHAHGAEFFGRFA